MPKLVNDPVSTKIPDPIKPYVFHGLDVDSQSSKSEATCDCPFCGREAKFSINVETGQWRCFVCGGDQPEGGGGVYQFLSQLHALSEQATTDYRELADNRGLEYPETLSYWGICKSILTGNWLVPAWGLDSKGKLQVRQLYHYMDVGGRKKLLATPTLKHALMGLNLYESVKPEICLCEGPWDALKLWEGLRGAKLDSDGNLTATTNPALCLLATTNVLAVPGCNTFNETWLPWFNGKNVKLLYDNDYPIENEKTKSVVPPASFAGMQRHANKLASMAKTVFYLAWGPGGYDPQLNNGTDVRDILCKHRINGLSFIFNRIEPVPSEWLTADGAGETSLQCQPCDSWRKLVNSWRKALKWTEGLEHGLAVMLASVSSTKSIGDQLWVKVLGPASCGKSTLCEAISVNKMYVTAKSTIRGFHSGYKIDQAGTQDTSLIPHIKDKTLIIKDGDTLLQAPNLPQILSEARDLYDTVSRTHYRNQMSRDYQGIRMTLLLCGTSSLRKLDSSELGERFLDCVIMDKIEPNIEDEILWRVANRAADDVGVETNGDMRSHYPIALTECMELTGGYVNWLRENAARILPTITFSDEAKRECIDVGKFVAYLRARPSIHQNEKAERELAARLVSQHIRLAKCLALVLNAATVDSEVMRRVKRVGMDTSRGVTLEVVRLLYSRSGGTEFKAISLNVNSTDGDLRALLRFLREIGVVRQVRLGSKLVWQLTDVLLELCHKML